MVRVAVLLLLLLPLHAAEEKSLLEQLTISKNSWKVVLAPTLNRGLDSEGLIRAGALPRQLQKAVSDFKEHVLDPQERAYLQRRAKNKVLQEQYQKVLEEVKKRDQLLFKEPSEEKRKEETEKINKKITEIRKKIAEIEKFPLENIPIPEKFRVQVSLVENEEKYQGGLNSLDKEEADLVLWADMTGQAGVYLTRLFSLSAVQRFPKLLWEGTTTKINSDYLESLRDFLATLLLNRPWGNLDITLQPEEGRIYLDGQLIGVGKIHKNGLEVDRAYEVEVYPQGYRSFRQLVTLSPSLTTTLVWPLQKQEESFLIVDSGEVSAEVYLGARFIGYTPLKMQRPDYSQTLTLLAMGYLPFSQTLQAELQQDIYVTLQPNPALTAQKELTQRKETFYWSASFFTLSLLLPLISGGMMENAGRLARANHAAGFNAAAQRYSQEETAAGIVLGSGLVVSGGLLIWSAINLATYIQAVERNAQPDIRDTYPKAASSKAESSKAESSKAESSKATSSKATSSKATSSKAESSKAESSKAESSKAESSKAESSKAESSKAESSKAVSAKAESSKAESKASKDQPSRPLTSAPGSAESVSPPTKEP